jgi:hypothetical protein
MSDLAVEHSLWVSIDGPAYGMGGSVIIRDEYFDEDAAEDYEQPGDWVSSSSMC